MLLWDEIGESALQKLMYTNTSIFLTGVAGSGKSTLINWFVQNTTKNVALLGSTGVSANNIGGKTIFSYFGFSPLLTKDKIASHFGQAMFVKKKKAINNTDTFIIDEISMVRADLMDLLDYIMRYITNRDLPFGGKQMVFVGDILQLPPVTTEKDARAFSGGLHSLYASPFFIDSNARKELSPLCIKLKHVYRQSDQKFINTLNAIRIGDMDNIDFNMINSCVNKPYDGLRIKPIYLATTNNVVDNINKQELERVNSTSFFSRAEITGSFSDKMYPTDETLIIKIGMQIMFIKNDRAGRFVNGTLGVVTNINNDNLSIETKSGDSIIVSKEKRTIYNQFYNATTKKMESSIVGTFTQYPIRIAWAITLHKSQGSTFDDAIIDLSGGVFATGQLYVGLSRVRSIEGLYLTIPIEPKHIKVREDVVLFDNSL